MGKFDLDDILRDLGDPDPDAPKEPNPGQDKAAGKDGAAPAFKRNDPRETPRPPDLTGTGLGGALKKKGVPADADPNRIRPSDALARVPGSVDDALARPTPDDVATYLLNKGRMTAEQMATADRVAKQSPGKRQSTILIEIGVDESEVQQAVAELSRLAFERIDATDPSAFDFKSFQKLGIEFCRDRLVMPLRKDGSRMVVGTVNPDDVFLLDDVKRRLGVRSIKHVLVTASDIRAVVEEMNAGTTDDYNVDDILADVEEDDVAVKKDQDDDGLDDADSSPVVRYVNHIIQTALKEGASDIHIEPDEKKLTVRFRIDGLLFEMMNPPRKMHAALTSRIKIMANLDIAERRLPQDGRIRCVVMGRPLDLRVSTVPTAKGEKTVMRILDNKSIQVSLDELGFHEDTLRIWKGQIAQPHGIILVTGPTGSGKTTTLYASLQQMDLRKLNISTVEDPVEYNLGSITQIQTHAKIGMTFAAALKALMRQDPDVVMIGEVRDMETATIAIQAALTGHLVLSTLHTNDAPSSVTRLINIGIESFLVAAALNAVLAQRLVRRICGNCAEPFKNLPDEIHEFLTMHNIDTDSIRKGKGCSKCRETGYSGRLGLYEMLVLDDFTRDEIARNPNVTQFRRTCNERGMVNLREDGMRKVADGRTTVEEVLRVTEATI